MVIILLLFSLVILSIIGIAFYFLRRSAAPNIEPPLPPRDFRGLFDEEPQTSGRPTIIAALSADERSALLLRAQNGERSVLAEVGRNGDAKLYDELLNVLVQAADSDARLLAL